MNDCIFYTEFQDGHATIIDCKLRDDGATYPTYHPECKNCIMHTTASEAAELVRQKRGIGMDSSAESGEKASQDLMRETMNTIIDGRPVKVYKDEIEKHLYSHLNIFNREYGA